MTPIADAGRGGTPMFEEIPEANCAGRDACLNPDPFRGDPPSPPHIPCPGPVDPQVGFTPVCLAGPGLGDRLLPPPSIGSPASAASNDRRRDDRMRLGDPNGNDVCCPVWTEPKGNGGGEFLRNSPAPGSCRARNVGFVRVVLQHGRRAARGRGCRGRRRVRARRPGRASVPKAGGAQG